VTGGRSKVSPSGNGSGNGNGNGNGNGHDSVTELPSSSGV